METAFTIIVVLLVGILVALIQCETKLARIENAMPSLVGVVSELTQINSSLEKIRKQLDGLSTDEIVGRLEGIQTEIESIQYPPSEE